MIDISNWKYFYKYTPNGTLGSTNMMYTPMVNPEGNVMCMLWDENSSYIKDNDNEIPKETIDYFFAREIKYIEIFKDRSWCPTLVDIDIPRRRVFIEWNNNTINHIFFDPLRSLDAECPDWNDQIFNILDDITLSGYYKMSLYPHCFFIDNNKCIKTFDFYSCLEISERYLPRKALEGIIGVDSTNRFDSSTVDDRIDFKKFFDLTLNMQLGRTWIDNPFPSIYKRLKNV
jgi:hypothetical protein